MVEDDRLQWRQVVAPRGGSTPHRPLNDEEQERVGDLDRTDHDMVDDDRSCREPSNIGDRRVDERVHERHERRQCHDEGEEVTDVLRGAPSHRGRDKRRSSQQYADDPEAPPRGNGRSVGAALWVWGSKVWDVRKEVA